jgi:hypothetical protein
MDGAHRHLAQKGRSGFTGAGSIFEGHLLDDYTDGLRGGRLAGRCSFLSRSIGHQSVLTIINRSAARRLLPSLGRISFLEANIFRSMLFVPDVLYGGKGAVWSNYS